MVAHVKDPYLWIKAVKRIFVKAVCHNIVVSFGLRAKPIKFQYLLTQISSVV